MKKQFLIIWWFVFSSTFLFAQEKEWQKLTDLLQNEASYFSGKSGYIRTIDSEYSTFKITEFSINETTFVSGMMLYDRFKPSFSERYLRETVEIAAAFEIQSAKIFYDCPFYFEDFPKSQFLLIEFDEPQLHQILSVYKDLNTQQEETQTAEETTTQLLIPIQSANRAAIFDAIDQYQIATKKEQLTIEQNY